MQSKFIPAIAAAVLSASPAANALEEPAYEVLRGTEDYEIRQYESYIVAEVDVVGNADDSGNRAFRILADYIFGNNDAREKMNMTAPVVSDAPSPDADTYTYAFVMESRYSLDTLPAPVDPRIRIVEKPGRIIAAREYSGRWTESNYRENEAILLGSLALDGLRTEGKAFLARYDDPFTPWFMRRNEVLVELALEQ